MGMRVTEHDLDTIRRICEAALDPGAWQAVLDAVAEGSGATGAGLFIEDSTTHELDLAAASSIFTPELLREHADSYRRLRCFPAGRLFPEAEILDGVLDSHRAAGRLHHQRIWLDVLAAQYRDQRTPLTARQLEQASLFLPHLAKTVELSRIFMVLRSRFQAVLAALDRYRVGVFVLTADMQVVLRNREADRILDRKDGLSLDAHRGLQAREPEQTNRLRLAVRHAADTALAREDLPETHLTVTRRAHSDPLLVQVCPLRDPGTELRPRFGGALVLVVDPADASGVSTRGMESLFQLTAAEADICRLLVLGHATEEIADIRRAAVETVRGQIKTVLRKTGTANRSQLVRLALTVNLPIDPS